MRKFVCLPILCIFISTIAGAQINKGSILLGGGFSIMNKKSETNNNRKETATYIVPSLGIAVKQNLVAGIELSYAKTKNNLNPSAAESEFRNYGAGVFVRNYVPLGKGFYLYGQSALYYSAYKYIYTYTADKSTEKYKSVGISLSPGLSYALNKRFQLEIGLASLVSASYQTFKRIPSSVFSDPQETKGFYLNANAASLSNVNIGFRIFLTK